jgi:hypothetical protein
MTKKWVLPVVLAAVLLAVIVLLGANSTRTVAQDTPPELQAELDAQYWHLCTIIEIAILPGRLHVRCTTPYSGSMVSFFAVPSDSANALMTNRYLTLLNSAFALGQKVNILFEGSSTLNPPGCAGADCRLIVGMIMDVAP